MSVTPQEVINRTLQIPETPFKAKLQRTGVEVVLEFYAGIGSTEPSSFPCKVGNLKTHSKQFFPVDSTNHRSNIKNNCDYKVAFCSDKIDFTTNKKFNSLFIADSIEAVLKIYLTKYSSPKTNKNSVISTNNNKSSFFVSYNVMGNTYLVKPAFRNVYELKANTQTITCKDEETAEHPQELFAISDKTTGLLVKEEDNYILERQTMIQKALARDKDNIPLQIIENEPESTFKPENLNAQYFIDKTVDTYSVEDIVFRDSEVVLTFNIEDNIETFRLNFTDLGRLPEGAEERINLASCINKIESDNTQDIQVKTRTVNVEDDTTWTTESDRYTVLNIE